MKPKLESLKPKNPRTIALEAVLLSYAVWKYKKVHSRVEDSRSKAPGHYHFREREDYPMRESVDEGNIDLTATEDSIVLSLYRGTEEESIKVEASKSGGDGTDDEKIEIKDMSTEDPIALETLVSAARSVASKVARTLSHQNTLQTDDE